MYIKINTDTKKSDNIKKIVVVSISEVLEDSKILLLCKGQIKLSKYIRTINSKTTRSLNKNPV